MTQEALLALAAMALSAFGAATLLPWPSEATFAAVLASGAAPVFLVFVTASLANTLGSCVNYWLGRQVERFEGRRWFPATPSQMARARQVFGRYGVWTLLLSALPFADPLTLAAGVLRTPFWLFSALVLISKTARYAAIVWLCDLVAWC